MYLVDSHCHLSMYKETELTDILTCAKECSVKAMQTICTNINDIPIILKIINENSNIFGSIGIHPDECTSQKQLAYKLTDASRELLESFGIKEKLNHFLTPEQLVTLSNHPKIIGIGETGLDYYHAQNNEEHKQQSKLFASHIEASQLSQLPVIVHTREAEDDTFDILRIEMRNRPFTGLIHCFTASKTFAKKILDLGLYISFAGIVTFKNAIDLQELVKFVPLDKLLIETDSPFLAPEPMRGKKNQPAYVKHIATKISELKLCSVDEIAQATNNNFFTLFNKAKAE